MTDYPDRCQHYAEWAARAGNPAVGKWTRLAARRHLRDLKKSARSTYPYVFSPEHVRHVCQFVELLPHVEGSWATATIRLEDWQVFLLGCVFGWRRRDNSAVRRFNTCYLELARKNAKSTLSAAVSLYCLACEGEIGPQVKVAATTGDQARIVFDIARKMVLRLPDLREALNIEAFANSVVCWSNAGNLRPINARASSQDGLNPHLTVIDELHAHKTRELFDVLKSARGSRKNPLSWYITTAGYDTEGVCYEQRALVIKMLENVVEADHYFGIIYTTDEGDDEFDEKVWPKSNPNLGVSVNLAEMRTYASEAKLSPDSHAEFLTKRLNVWTHAKSGWVNLPKWRACSGPVDLEALVNLPCYGGLDLASTSDMCSFRLVWLTDNRLKTWGRYYLPEAAVEPRTKRGNVPYQRWAKEGRLVVTPGNVTDFEYIERDVMATLTRFRVEQIAYDPWNATDLVNRLVSAGAPMLEFLQSITQFTGPMRELERYYLDGRLDHAGDPVLLWNAANIVARKDANANIAPDRKNSLDKIDGFVTLVMALGAALKAEKFTSVYESRGIGLL